MREAIVLIVLRRAARLARRRQGRRPRPASAAAAHAPPRRHAGAGGTGSAGQPARRATSYRPEGRRDPFVSLVRRGSDVGQRAECARSGPEGTGRGEVTLRGTVASQGGYVAILQGADSKTYIVRPGEQLADGTIRSITADALVILQQVNDPLSLEKQREVRKVLRQTEEGRQ